jgi:hypothetical protein
MKLDPFMSTDGQWAKAFYLTACNHEPWTSSNAWAARQPDDRRSSSPQDAQQRPNLKQATDWLRPPGFSSPSVVFHDGRRSVQAEQQQQQQQQPHQHPDEADDFVYKKRTNAHGDLEWYCVTCSAWLGDDPPTSGHLSSAKHLSWGAHFEKQKIIKNAMGGTPAGVGTPSRPLAGPPQRASFVFGRGPSEAETPDLVTYDDLAGRFERRYAQHQQSQDNAMKKLNQQQRQQQHVIDKLERQQQQITEEMHKLRHLMLDIQQEVTSEVKGMHEFLNRELARE